MRPSFFANAPETVVRPGILAFALGFLVVSLFLCPMRAWAGNSPETWPVTLDEAIAHIVGGLPAESVKTLCGTKKRDLILYHHGWGTGIRNSFGLWGGNEALLVSACGGKRCHPDDASMRIIEGVWETLQREACTANRIRTCTLEAVAATLASVAPIPLVLLVKTHRLPPVPD